VFADPGLLERALAHRSWCAELNDRRAGTGEADHGSTAGDNGSVPGARTSPGVEESNERLEFLGDSVVGLAVTEYMYRHFSHLAEGSMAKVRASVVSTDSLARAATELRIGEALKLGRGEEMTGGREKTSLLADAFEAVVGAVYLDGGWDAACSMVLNSLGDRVREAMELPGSDDHKTRLQEEAAGRFGSVPSYEIAEEGPDHAKTFMARVTIDGREWGRGRGRSKKRAQQEAARVAWEAMTEPTRETQSS